MAGRNWSDRENELTVRAYFEMFELELRHEAFNKAERNRALLRQLDARTRGAVELKHMNISAVLQHLGSPSIDGYKPLPNYQDSLATAVQEHLLRHPEIQDLMDKVAASMPKTSYDFHLFAPERQVEKPEPLARDRGRRTVSQATPRMTFNYAERDAANRALGKLGEKFVVDFEKARLKRAGRSDLAAKVEWSSRERGDGLGYDIQSFGADGGRLLIEVKTTNFGLRSPFIISPNEIAVSEHERATYRLYRVFRFTHDPRFFELVGAVRDSCELTPRSYLARVTA